VQLLPCAFYHVRAFAFHTVSIFLRRLCVQSYFFGHCTHIFGALVPLSRRHNSKTGYLLVPSSASESARTSQLCVAKCRSLQCTVYSSSGMHVIVNMEHLS
jgi:hypothetical protein